MEEGGEPVIETSDATSSSEVVQNNSEKSETPMEEVKVEVDNELPEQQIDIEGCRQQLLQQQREQQKKRDFVPCGTTLPLILSACVRA